MYFSAYGDSHFVLSAHCISCIPPDKLRNRRSRAATALFHVIICVAVQCVVSAVSGNGIENVTSYIQFHLQQLTAASYTVFF